MTDHVLTSSMRYKCYPDLSAPLRSTHNRSFFLQKRIQCFRCASALPFSNPFSMYGISPLHFSLLKLDTKRSCVLHTFLAQQKLEQPVRCLKCRYDPLDVSRNLKGPRTCSMTVVEDVVLHLITNIFMVFSLYPKRHS
jgi:hypothetical protein